MGLAEVVEEGILAVPQRGVFVAKHILQSTLSAVAFGVCGGVVGSFLLPNALGPLIPYLVCSSAGFVYGSATMWFAEVRQAKHWAQLYPDLVQHHLVPTMLVQGAELIDVSKTDFETLPLGLKTWVILAAQSAAADVHEIRSQTVASIIERRVQEAMAAAEVSAKSSSS